jgi:SAM-dependent methyltransferase
MTAPRSVPPVPAVLRLVQSAVLGRYRATGEDLYREVALEIEAGAGKEVIVSGCGDGVTTLWLATRTGCAVTGVDSDPEGIERAEARARAVESPRLLSYTAAPLDDLPHENSVFDAAIGEPALAAAVDPARAVQELVRVTKPLGAIVLLQLTWSSELDEADRELVVERLGLRPRMLVEWKQMLRDAGAVEIQVQDWTEGGPRCFTRTPGQKTPISTPQLRWQDKVQIVGQAWRRWGWRASGLRAGRDAVERESALLRDLSRQRVLGFQLIKGVKWPHAKTP